MPTHERLLQRARQRASNDPTGSTCATTRVTRRVTPGSGPTARHSPRRRDPDGFQRSRRRLPGARLPDVRLHARRRRRERHAPALGVQPVARADPLPGGALRHARAATTVPTALCTNPGGVGGDRTGTANLPAGSTSGASARDEERRRGDRRALLRGGRDAAEERRRTRCRSTSSDLAGGILVTGANANHTVADPTNEASTGFIGRDAINPLQQLKAVQRQPGRVHLRAGQRPDRRAGPGRPRSRRRRRERPRRAEPVGRRRPADEGHARRSTTRPSTATSSRRATRTRGRATCTCRPPTRTRSRSSRARRCRRR